MLGQPLSRRARGLLRRAGDTLGRASVLVQPRRARGHADTCATAVAARVGRERERPHRQQPLQLRDGAGARDRRRHPRLRGQPRQRHRGHGHAVPGRDLVEHGQHAGPARIVQVLLGARPRARSPTASAAVLAGQEALRQPVVREAGQPAGSVTQRFQPGLERVALHEVVVRLDRGVGGEPVPLGDLQRRTQPLRREVRGPDLPDLARPAPARRTRRGSPPARCRDRPCGRSRDRSGRCPGGAASRRPPRRCSPPRAPDGVGHEPTFVAITSASRPPRAASHSPMIVSDSPPELPGARHRYESAVSIIVPPASTNASSTANDSSRSAVQPNTLPPRHSPDTSMSAIVVMVATLRRATPVPPGARRASRASRMYQRATGVERLALSWVECQLHGRQRTLRHPRRRSDRGRTTPSRHA